MHLLNNSFMAAITRKFPFLIKLKRYFMAYKDTVKPARRSYSQHGEDLLVMKLLPGISPGSGIYIEVGANQPTQISNTYLFYRMGFHGIVIEPNREMTGLFRRFRPKDVHLEIGCAEHSGIGKFKKAASSVISGFSDSIKAAAGSVSRVPLLPIDEIWRDAAEKETIFLLSIDTEGFDLQVLKGAKETLKHTACIIIETGGDDTEIKTILEQAGFKPAGTTQCNCIWINEDAAKKISQP